MGLALYHRKRNFKKTAEPAGRTSKHAKEPIFVIQKHAATRLHFDFRLEMDGVLKSWAVPKGPSLDPADKRLAVHVEDHPIEYATFEGSIPKGEYGGGTVQIWDHGTWEPLGEPHRDYNAGKLKFRLHGKRLNGDWALVRMGGRASENGKNWLLLKEKDRLHPNSKPLKQEVEPQVPLPEDFKPELATLVEQAPAGESWLHEVKFDGYRLLCVIRKGKVSLMTRNNLDWTDRFQVIADAAAQLPIKEGILDGEVVVQNPDGTTDFQKLQNYLQGRENNPLFYYVFDVPFLDGTDLTNTPLLERKRLLRKILPKETKKSVIRYSDHIQGNGDEVFGRACRLNMEGIMSKRADSLYVQGRTKDWLKVKCTKSQEFVIGGYTDPQKSRQYFGSLLLGYYDKEGRLHYSGNVGTGFDDATLKSVFYELKKREQSQSPYAGRIDRSTRDVHWVKPELIAQVNFTEITGGGSLRHPSFVGLRQDKKPHEVLLEKAQPPVEAAPKPSSQRLYRLKKDEEEIAGVRVSHPNRVLYPEQGLTKRDLAAYYEQVADWMLPHIEGRPLSLVRCPQGRAGQCFFQKHLTELLMDPVRGVKIKEKESQGVYTLVDDVKGLIYLTQIGVLEIHPWPAHEKNVEKPDLLVFDLDPAPDVKWNELIVAAKTLKKELEELDLESFVKTTGGKGLHVVVPIQPSVEWEEFRAFSKRVADKVVEDRPDRYVATMSKAKRGGKIFIDYFRNTRGATAVAPYSTRAREGAPVALPIAWTDLNDRLDPKAFTVKTVPALLQKVKKDPWKDLFKKRQRLPAS